jgi:hypothetical protein
MPRAKTPATEMQTLGSWRDWLPEGMTVERDELITRTELAAALMQNAVLVEPNDLRFWERVGVLPRAIKQWHDTSVQAVYPIWFVELVVGVRMLQWNGWTLAQIGRFYRQLGTDFRVFMAEQAKAA